MKKAEIEHILREKQTALRTFLSAHPDELWNKGPELKWTTGQHIIHLTVGTKALNKALSMPKFLLSYKFGKANRDTRSYEEVVERYKERLAIAVAKGGEGSKFTQNLGETPPEGKNKLIADLDAAIEQLIKKLNRQSEDNLNKYLIPHPLMGRMILREIIMWTAHHTEHHHLILQDKYVDLT